MKAGTITTVLSSASRRRLDPWVGSKKEIRPTARGGTWGKLSEAGGLVMRGRQRGAIANMSNKANRGTGPGRGRESEKG